MATTGWGLIYFNLFNLFKIHNLHTSLPLSSRSARHLHSSCPFVICCTAQSTFLPISCFPALSPLKLGRGALFRRKESNFLHSEESNLCQFLWAEQRKQFVSIFQRLAEFPSISSRRSRRSRRSKKKKKTLDIADHQSMICLVGCNDASMPLAGSQNFQESHHV